MSTCRGLYIAPSDNTTIVTNMAPRSEIVSEIQNEAITNSPTKDMNFLTTKSTLKKENTNDSMFYSNGNLYTRCYFS